MSNNGAGDNNVNTTEIAEALSDTSGVLASSDNTKTTSDSDSAIKSTTSGASVDVPKDASDGITLDPAGGAPAIDISLPNADSALVTAFVLKKPVIGHGLILFWLALVVTRDLLVHDWVFACIGGVILACSLAVLADEIRK